MTGRWAYSAFMALALIVFVLARRVLPRPPALAARPAWQRWVLGLAAFAGGVLGAKLPFIDDNPLSLDIWLADGKTIITGLAGAYLAVEFAKACLGIRDKTGDTFALPLALALAVGRWGCFFNGCCYGTPTSLPWAANFGDGVMRHPTQIYESLFHLTMAALLGACMLRGRFHTHLLQLYLISYCAFRFVTEWIRPEPAWCFGLTFYQTAALALMSVLALQWWWEEHTNPKRQRGKLA